MSSYYRVGIIDVNFIFVFGRTQAELVRLQKYSKEGTLGVASELTMTIQSRTQQRNGSILTKRDTEPPSYLSRDEVPTFRLISG